MMKQITFTRHDGTKAYDFSHDEMKAAELFIHLQNVISKANKGNAIFASYAQYKDVEVEEV